MEIIRTEINKLLKILENMKNHYEEYSNNQMMRYLNETLTVGDNIQMVINELLNKNRKLYNASTIAVDKDFMDKMLILSLTENKDAQFHLFKINFVKDYHSILNVVVNLNKLLDKPIKKVQSLQEVQHKIMLSIKDVESLYGFSKTQQQGYRSRLRNPLPYIKDSSKLKSANTKVQYKKQELEDWIYNFL